MMIQAAYTWKGVIFQACSDSSSKYRIKPAACCIPLPSDFFFDAISTNPSQKPPLYERDAETRLLKLNHSCSEIPVKSTSGISSSDTMESISLIVSRFETTDSSLSIVISEIIIFCSKTSSSFIFL